MATSEILDQAALDQLRDLGSGDDLLREIIDLFLSEAPPDMARLQAACASGNADEVHRLAHRIRGMCGDLGATSVARHCADLERMSAGPVSSDELDPVVSKAATALVAVESALHDLR